eukprot:1344560-Ditylum_brightwellii.AAC.1
MVSKDLKGWKFEKWRIMCMLELLIQAVDYVWETDNTYNDPSNVVISQKNSSLWPEEDNFLHLPGVSIVHEVDTSGKEVHQGDSDDEMMTDGGDVLGNNGLDEGPAPLQTVQPLEIIFE